MVRVLSDEDVAGVLDLGELLGVVGEAFRRQGAGTVERPHRPHYSVGRGLDREAPGEPTGIGIAMPAYIHGREYYATKLVGVHEDNPERGLDTVNAQIALTDAANGLPAAYVAGTRITNARTGCIGGLAARELATGPVSLGVIGAGKQARWQTRAIDAAADLRSVRVYSPSDSKVRCAADLRAELGVDAEPVDSPTAAVEGANVVVTATTATEPVFPGDALAPGALVVAVGAYNAEMQELDPRTFERAGGLFADVPEEAVGTGDSMAAGLEESDLVPFSAVLEGEAGRQEPGEIVIVQSVGTAVLDAAAAEHLLDAAEDAGAGTAVEL